MTPSRTREFLLSLHPAAKIAATAVLSAACFASGSMQTIVSLGLLAIFVASIARVVQGLIASTQGVLLFLMVIIIASAFGIGGEILTGAEGFYVTREGLSRGLLLAARLLTAAWWASLLVLVTPTEQLADGLEWMTRPFGRPGAQAGVFLRLTISIIPVMIRSATTVKLAREARGMNQGGGIINGLRNAGAAAIPVLATAVREAGHLADAVDARGYDPRQPRTLYAVSSLQARDIAALLVAGAAVAMSFLF